MEIFDGFLPWEYHQKLFLAKKKLVKTEAIQLTKKSAFCHDLKFKSCYRKEIFDSQVIASLSDCDTSYLTVNIITITHDADADLFWNPLNILKRVEGSNAPTSI